MYSYLTVIVQKGVIILASNDEKIMLMKNEKIPIALLKLGLPTMIGMIVSALYSVVDAYFVGGLGTSQMGAVSIVFPIVQIIIGLGMTFGNGAASYTSRLLGEGNQKRASQTASTALFTSLAVGIISIVLSLGFLDKLLVLLGATPTILPYAHEYAAIYIAGSIFNIFNVTMNNLVVSEGAAKLAMISMLTGGGLNVILDPVFIYLLGFGIKGAAIATILSQATVSTIYMRYILGKKGYLRFTAKNFRFDKIIFIEIFKIGIPILLFQLLSSISMGLTNMLASDYGDSAVAAMGIVIRIMTLGTYVVFGFMKGFQPLAGYNYGAKRYDRLNEATKTSLKWATCFCIIVALVAIIFPVPIISLFSKNDTLLISMGSKALRANGVIFPFFGLQMVYMSLFLALGKGREGGILSVSRQGIFFIPTILLLPKFFGINGLIATQPVSDTLTVILTAIFAMKLKKTLKRKSETTDI